MSSGIPDVPPEFARWLQVVGLFCFLGGIYNQFKQGMESLKSIKVKVDGIEKDGHLRDLQVSSLAGKVDSIITSNTEHSRLDTERFTKLDSIVDSESRDRKATMERLGDRMDKINERIGRYDARNEN